MVVPLVFITKREQGHLYFSDALFETILDNLEEQCLGDYMFVNNSIH